MAGPPRVDPRPGRLHGRRRTTGPPGARAAPFPIVADAVVRLPILALACPPCGGAEERLIISRHPSARPTGSGFDRFDLRRELLAALADAGFTEPRPVQDLALPPALAGRDVLGLAQTGTGKTAAFALPILQRLLGAPRPGPRALVVAPTRELAAQVHAAFEELARHTRIVSTAVFGGVPIGRQERVLRGRPDVLVACPGRLLDLLGRRAVRLDGIEVLVLDEADHMLDMGFLPDVKRILRALPARRQTMLFSATMPPEIRTLAAGVLSKPAVVELGHSRPADTIAHALYAVDEGQKVAALERLLSGETFRSAIVFLRTKRRARNLATRLQGRGLAAVALQGNMSQAQRERALRGFRDGSFDVLVATDVAARGLDIAGISHVINFDVPGTPDAYTHRIGRTGRSGAKGTAYTFVTRTDGDALGAIEKRLGERIPRRALQELGPLPDAGREGRETRPAAGPPGRRKRGQGAPARRRTPRPARAAAAAVVRVARAERGPVRPAGPGFGHGLDLASAPS